MRGQKGMKRIIGRQKKKMKKYGRLTKRNEIKKNKRILEEQKVTKRTMGE